MSGHCRANYLFFLPSVGFGLDGEAVLALRGLPPFFGFLSFFAFLDLGLALVDPGEALASSSFRDLRYAKSWPRASVC